MSQYKRLIDEAMKTASYRLNAGVDKTASAFDQSSIVKEASELANALEYMSIASANDGTSSGAARAEMIRDFHKQASAQRLGIKLAGDVGEQPTMASGVQAHAPEHGKTRLMPKKEVGGNPMVTASPDSTGKTMLESYKQANSGSTLYDILMHQKEAGDVGEYDASQYMSVTGANENSNRSILDDASILSGVSKQEAKAPVRARLSEAFASTSDTLGDQTVRSLFPHAYQGGGLKKTASDVGKLERAKELLTGSKVRKGFSDALGEDGVDAGKMDRLRMYANVLTGKADNADLTSEARKSLATQLGTGAALTGTGVGGKAMYDKKKKGQEKSASYYRLRSMLE